MMSSFTYNKAIDGSLHKYGARILLAFGTRMGTTAQTVSYPNVNSCQTASICSVALNSPAVLSLQKPNI